MSAHTNDEEHAAGGGQLCAWFWKRGPRASDTDKAQLRRLLWKSNNKPFKRRYFVMDASPSELNMRYFASEKTSGAALGIIDLRTILSIHNHMDEEAEESTPAPYMLVITTTHRVWTLCSESSETVSQWQTALEAFLHKSGVAHAEGNRRSESSPTLVRVPASQQSVSKFQRALSSWMRSDRKPNDDKAETIKLAMPGNLKEQTRRLRELKGQDGYAFYSGNVPFLCTSFLSDYDLDVLDFMHTFISWCNHHNPDQYVMEHVFNLCPFMMPEEGHVFIMEGEQVRDVIFVLSGEAVRRKLIYGVSQTTGILESGDFFGDVEALCAPRAVSTVVAGPGLVALTFPRPMFQALSRDSCFIDLAQAVKRRQQELLLELLMCMPLFEEVDADLIPSLLQLFTMEHYESDARIVTQGDASTTFYILVQGSAKVTKVHENGREENVFVLKTGDWFGEIGLLKNQPRNSNITSVGPLSLLKTGRAGFDTFLSLGSEKMRRKLEDNVTEIMSRAIGKIPLFSDMTMYFEIIAPRMFYREIPAGTVICRQGEPSDAFYIVIHGQAIGSFDFIEGLQLTNGRDPPAAVDIYEENDYFGMRGLNHSSDVMECTITTSTHSVMLVTPADKFVEIISLCPNFNTRMDHIQKTRSQKLSRNMNLYQAIRSAAVRQTRETVKTENLALQKRIMELEKELSLVKDTSENSRRKASRLRKRTSIKLAADDGGEVEAGPEDMILEISHGDRQV